MNTPRRYLILAISFAALAAACGSSDSVPQALPLADTGMATSTTVIEVEPTVEPTVSPMVSAPSTTVAPTTTSAPSATTTPPMTDTTLVEEGESVDTTMPQPQCESAAQHADDCVGLWFGGEYEICTGEAIVVAYPEAWYSAPELGDEGFCSWFRAVPVDGHIDHQITVTKHADAVLAQPYDQLAGSGAWVLLEEETFTDPSGDRIRIVQAHESDPTFPQRAIWLIELNGSVWEFHAQDGGDHVAVLDTMMESLSFIAH